MFYVSGKLNDYVYEVTDTDDGVVDMVTYNDLINYVKQGYEIKGVLDDIVFPYTDKATPYTGIEIKGMRPYKYYYGEYSYARKRQIIHTSERYVYNAELKKLQHIPFFSKPVLFGDGEFHTYDQYGGTFNDLGLVASSGSFSSTAFPEFMAKLGLSVYNSIKDRSSGSIFQKMTGEISKVNFEKLYIFDKEYGVYRRQDFTDDNAYNLDSNYKLEKQFALSDFCNTPSDELLGLCRVTGVHAQVSTTNSSVIINRVLRKTGISYYVIKSGENPVLVSLEDIYKNLLNGKDTCDFHNLVYSNAKINGDILTIRGFDGVFEYDMNIIFAVYGNAISEYSKKLSSKMKLLGQNGDIKINERGELVYMSSDDEVLKVPKEVNKLLKGSIKLAYENKCIEIPKSVCVFEKGFYIRPYTTFHFSVKTDIDDLGVLTSLCNLINTDEIGGIYVSFITSPSQSNFVSIVLSYFTKHYIGDFHLRAEKVFEGYDKSWITSDICNTLLKRYYSEVLNNCKWLNKPIRLRDFEAKKLLRTHRAEWDSFGSYKKYGIQYKNFSKLIMQLGDVLDADLHKKYVELLTQLENLLINRRKEFSKYLMDNYNFSRFI